MPWPTFSHMTDHDIEAIYEYLSAIPCIDNSTSTPPAGAPNELQRLRAVGLTERVCVTAMLGCLDYKFKVGAASPYTSRIASLS